MALVVLVARRPLCTALSPSNADDFVMAPREAGARLGSLWTNVGRAAAGGDRPLSIVALTKGRRKDPHSGGPDALLEVATQVRRGAATAVARRGLNAPGHA